MPPFNFHFPTAPLACALAAAAWLFGSAPAHAEPLVPRSDGEVIEVLPQVPGGRAEERRLRQKLAAHPRDAALAVSLARRYIDQAREQGDPRYAGRALAVLEAWSDIASAPDDVLLMQATVQQYLHEFDTSAHKLEALVKRRPDHPQAWLTLATVRRVQGRYAESDAACRALGAVATAAARPGGATPLYARACQAENDGLRGDFAGARATLAELLATQAPDAGSRAWLLTTLAELEARAGRPVQAELRYKMALDIQADDYARLSYTDFLLFNQRDANAAALLQGQPRTDALLLRLAILGARSGTPAGAHDVQEMRERMAQAALRPNSQATHAREQAMFALWVDRQPARALSLARADVKMQREPIDVLLLAQAAKAADNAAAQQEAQALSQDMGLRDERLASLR